MFNVLDLPGLFNGRPKILHHHLQEAAPLNHIMCGLLEELKEGFFSRDQSKQHRDAPQFRYNQLFSRPTCRHHHSAVAPVP
jgi:hypothetical protein